LLDDHPGAPALVVRQENRHPNDPQPQGKAERFQQAAKKWLRTGT
jgi:hypothetical protein